MKMCTIAENKFTDLAYKLNKEIEQYGESDLRDLVRNPRETVALIRRGSLSKVFAFTDKNWIEQFLKQWHLLDENTLQHTFELAYKDVMDKYENIQQKTAKKDGSKATTEDIFQSELMVMEGVGSFLGKLAKWAILIMQILTLAIVGGGRGYGRGGRRISPDDLRILNPYAIYRLTKRLYDTSVAVYNRGRSVP